MPGDTAAALWTRPPRRCSPSCLKKHGLLPNVQVVGESAQGGCSRCASCLPSLFRGVRVSSARAFSYPRVEANYAKREVCGRAIGCSAKTPRKTRNARMRWAHTSLQRHLRTPYRSAPRSLQCSHFIKSKLRSHSPAYGDVAILKRERRRILRPCMDGHHGRGHRSNFENCREVEPRERGIASFLLEQHPAASGDGLLHCCANLCSNQGSVTSSFT